LGQPAKTDNVFKTIFIGIGNELNGDDGAGLAVLEGLTGLGENVLVLSAGAAPESFTGPIRQFNPDLVVMIDAAHTGALPGTVHWLAWQELEGFSGSTHTLPLNLLADFLAKDLACEVALIGIEAGQTEFDRPISEPVRQAAVQVAAAIRSVLLDR